jgi:hypothetical protein
LVQTIFGMHLFDKDTPQQNRVSFYISIVSVAVVTWVLSGLAIWAVGRPDRWKMLENMWGKLWVGVRRIISKCLTRTSKGGAGEP